MEKKNIRIGTSGWSYEHWFGRFYPRDMAKNKAFEYYQTQFDTVELNVTFYRLVSEKTFKSWADKTTDFVFAVKGSRYLTHIKRLKNYEESLDRFLKPLSALGDKTGPILFQLPANYQKDLAILELFIEGLPNYLRFAFEFRHKSWFHDDIYTVLKDNNTALVLSNSPFFPYEEQITADFAYIRWHGPSQLYGGNYSDKDLSRWSEKILSWADHGIDVFGYFNNDYNAFAPHNALKLKEFIAGRSQKAA